MRAHQKIFPVLLCGTVLLAAGCGRGAEQEEARVVQEETSAPRPAEEAKGYVIEEPTAVPETVETQAAAELRREPVVDGRREADLAARERRIEERQAEVEARERALRRSERPQRPAPPAPADRSGEINAPAEAIETSRPVETEPEVAAAPEERELPRPASVTVPAGTVVEVELLEGLASDTSRAGETFRARVVSDVQADGGGAAIPDGSEVVGVVDEVVPLRKVGGRAKIALRFTDLVLPSGATVPIRASLVEEGRSETKRDAATIGGATAGGAILGRILSKRGDRSKGTVIGAVLGAAAGTAIASRTPGEEVVLAAGTVVNLSLDDDVEIRSRR